MPFMVCFFSIDQHPSNFDMELTIFDIPEVIDLISSHLEKYELYPCTLVSRSWRNAFVPFYYRHIRVFDFDYNYVEDNLEEDETPPPDTDLGRSNIQAYSPFIHTIWTASIKSLMDLGPQCTQLTQLRLLERRVTYDDPDFEEIPRQGWPDSQSGSRYWYEDYFPRFYSQSTEVWVRLLKGNPGLRIVKITFCPVDDQEMIVEALVGLKYLQELEFGVGYEGTEVKQKTLETVKEKCTGLKRLMTMGYNLLES